MLINELLFKFATALGRGLVPWLAGDDRTPPGGDEADRDRAAQGFAGALERLFARYPDSPSMCLWRAREVSALDELEFPEPILDVGCGDGGLADVVFGARAVIGADLDPVALRFAAERGNYHGVALADVTALPYGPELFASVLVNCVAEHVDDPDTLLREAWRVTRPGGNVAMTVPSEKFGRFFAARALLAKLGMAARGERVLARYNDRQRHLNMDSAETWRARYENAGWTGFSARPIVDPETAVLFTALDIVWLSPLPWKPHNRLGGGGAWLTHWLKKSARKSLPALWTEMFRQLVGNAPDPPATGAGWLITAVKPAGPGGRQDDRQSGG